QVANFSYEYAFGREYLRCFRTGKAQFAFQLTQSSRSATIRSVPFLSRSKVRKNELYRFRQRLFQKPEMDDEYAPGRDLRVHSPGGASRNQGLADYRLLGSGRR